MKLFTRILRKTDHEMKPFTRTLRKTDHFPKCPGNWLSQKDKIWYIDKGRQCWVTTLLDVKIGLLKVDSLGFECIIILLIYFLNCRKALFTRK